MPTGVMAESDGRPFEALQTTPWSVGSSQSEVKEIMARAFRPPDVICTDLYVALHGAQNL